MNWYETLDIGLQGEMEVIINLPGDIPGVQFVPTFNPVMAMWNKNGAIGGGHNVDLRADDRINRTFRFYDIKTKTEFLRIKDGTGIDKSAYDYYIKSCIFHDYPFGLIFVLLEPGKKKATQIVGGMIHPQEEDYIDSRGIKWPGYSNDGSMIQFSLERMKPLSEIWNWGYINR